MDDSANRTYSRAPEFEDVVTLCEALNKAGVDYILIGGFAVIIHGFVRGTHDIDLLVNSSKENIQKIKRALSYLPDNAISLIQDDEVEKYAMVRIADEIVIDLMANACNIDYNDAKSEIEFKEIEGIKIPVASKPLLIKMKNTVRPSDKTDVNYLLVAIEEENKK